MRVLTRHSWRPVAALAAAAMAQAVAVRPAGAEEEIPAAPLREPTSREISLYPGDQKSLSAEGVDAISTGRPGVASVRISRDQKEIIIVALAPGVTRLLLVMLDGRKLEYKISVAKIVRRQNVRLDVYFVQVADDSTYKLGIGWPTAVGASVSGGLTMARVTGTPTVVQRTLAVSSTVLPRLDFGETEGWVRVLDQARIVIANGEEGSYSAHNDLNFRLSTGLQASLGTITSGVKISGRAAYDEVTGRMDIALQAEFSKFTAAVGDGLPGRSISTVNTRVNLEVGQSLAVAAVNTSEKSTGHSGLPLLAQIPVLGWLFGSHDYKTANTQNVVFVVPSLVDSVGLRDRDRISEALELFAEDGGTVAVPLSDTLGNDRPNQLDGRRRRLEKR